MLNLLSLVYISDISCFCGNLMTFSHLNDVLLFSMEVNWSESLFTIISNVFCKNHKPFCSL